MIALIPARGGSKGLPGKNIKSLCGKPLIAYTIQAALNASGINQVVVTTDSEEIAEISRQYGAEVPFLRPKELAEDTSSAVDVYLHAIDFLQKKTGKEIQKFMVLLPTAPLREAKDIEQAIRYFFAKKAETLISMKEAEIPISWYYGMDEQGRIKNMGFDEQNAVENRQSNRTYYIPNGAIYILDTKLLRERHTYYSDNTVAYLMSQEKSVDIDCKFDFKMAELLLSQN